MSWTGPRTGEYWREMTDEEVLRYHYGRRENAHMFGINPVWYAEGEVPGVISDRQYNWSFIIMDGRIIRYVHPRFASVMDNEDRDRLYPIFKMVLFPEVVE